MGTRLGWNRGFNRYLIWQTWITPLLDATPQQVYFMKEGGGEGVLTVTFKMIERLSTGDIRLKGVDKDGRETNVYSIANNDEYAEIWIGER